MCIRDSITNAQNQKYWQDPELAEAFQARNKEAFIRRKRALKKALLRMVGEQTGRAVSYTHLTRTPRGARLMARAWVREMRAPLAAL